MKDKFMTNNIPDPIQENFAQKIALFPMRFFKDKLGKGSTTTAKLIGLSVLAIYILSPIDLIPDFIPLFGQLDDLGVLVAMRVGVGNSYLAEQSKDVKAVDIKD
jgi:uncharacterized membrane protein YkvA (DUF1232 family)